MNDVRPTYTMNRRALLRFLAAGTGSTLVASLLAACGGGANATNVPNPQPTTTTTTTIGAGSAPAPTKAAASPVVSASTPAASPAASGTSGGQVSVRWAKPATLHPLFSTIGSEQQIERLMFGTLVKMTDKLVPVPDLAETVNASPDATTYTFTLRKGITFTDGTPLTANDVVFTIERAVDKRTASYWRGRLLALRGASEYGDQKTATISGLETPDDYTIKMTLAAPDASWLTVLGNFAGLGILPAHILKDTAPDQMAKSPFSFNPNVTAGVFQFSQYATDQYLELKRNEGYSGPKAKLDRLFFKILTPDTALIQMETGELDVMSVNATDAERLKKNANLSVVSVPSPSLSSLTFNEDKPYLKDKRVRQAIQYAIDREGIVKEIFRGEAQVVNSTIIGPDWMGAPAGLNAYAYNPDKARQLLKDANWDSSRKLETIYISGSKEQDAYAPIIQQQCKEIGLTLDLLVVDAAEYNRKRISTTGYEVAFVNGGIFRADPNVSAQYFETVNFTPSGGNYARYSNPMVDDLFRAGRSTTNTDERKKTYTQLAQILNEDLPWVCLWSPNSIFAYNKRLVGFKPPSYVDNPAWNADEWTITK